MGVLRELARHSEGVQGQSTRGRSEEETNGSALGFGSEVEGTQRGAHQHNTHEISRGRGCKRMSHLIGVPTRNAPFSGIVVRKQGMAKTVMVQISRLVKKKK